MAVSAKSAIDPTPLGLTISTDLTKLELKEKLSALVPRYVAEVAADGQWGAAT